jgi:hypothetical protein
MSYLPVRSVNQVHLVCKHLDRIANMHVNPLLLFDKKTLDLTTLVQSSRAFEEWKFSSEGCNYLCNFESVDTARILEFASFVGPHVKRLTIHEGYEMDQKVVEMLMNKLPYLESFDFYEFHFANDGDHAEWKLELAKIKHVVMRHREGLEKLLDSLAKCTIESFEVHEFDDTVQRFLTVHQKHLKKLELALGSSNLLNAPEMDLKLEHLELQLTGIPVEFLRRQKGLKSLSLMDLNVSDAAFNALWNLKDLEVLDLMSISTSTGNFDALNNLFKLKKLKVLRLGYGQGLRYNIIDYLRFGVFVDLTELDADYRGASVESIAEMKRFAPNLEVIRIRADSSDVVNCLLEQYGSLGKLKAVTILSDEWILSANQQFVCPYVKDICCYTVFAADSAYRLTKMFPNLEHLSMWRWPITLSMLDSLVVLVTHLKQIKKLDLVNGNDRSETETLDSELIVQCIRDHGQNLEDVQLLGNYDFGVPRIVEGFVIWDQQRSKRRFKRTN